MQKLAHVAVAATAIVSMWLPGVMVAQNAPATGGGTTTAPAATAPPTATATTPAAASSDATTTQKAAPKKKKKPAKMTRHPAVGTGIAGK